MTHALRHINVPPLKKIKNRFPQKREKRICLKVSLLYKHKIWSPKENIKKGHWALQWQNYENVMMYIQAPWRTLWKAGGNSTENIKLVQGIGVFQVHKLSEAESAQCIIMTIVQALYFQEKSLSGNAHDKK